MEEIQSIIKEKIDVEIDFESPKTLGLARNKKSISSRNKIFRNHFL